MIRLEKRDKPEWLIKNAHLSTRAYLASPPSERSAPWRQSSIVEALRAESHGKCIYCEGLIEDISYAAVEHIAPKSEFPELVLDWDNLGLVCQRCNTNKSDYWSETIDLRILNPYVDPVDSHLEFVGPVVAAKAGSLRGENTVRRIRLKREELVLSKMLRIEEMEQRLLRWFGESNAEIKTLLAEDIRDAFEPGREFSATLVSYAHSRGFPV